MNVYEMEGFLRGKCLPGDLLVGESHAAYLVRKLNESATLKADRDAQQKLADALAVENVAIKAMNDCLSEELRGYEYDGAFEGPHMHLLWWKTETPATDAAIAAIEARGVAKALAIVEACRGSICAGGLSENRQYEESIVHPHLDGISDELEALAAELREAK